MKNEKNLFKQKNLMFDCLACVWFEKKKWVLIYSIFI